MKTWQWIVAALMFVSIIGLALWLTPKLPDVALFWLKLFSFIATATFGVIGVTTDFKDDKRKLTRAGKLNLVSLVLAVLIGVIAQKAEYESGRNASDRILEVFGDQITVSYVAQLHLDSTKLQGVEEYIGAKLTEIAHDGYFIDDHTLVLYSLIIPGTLWRPNSTIFPN